ncbi:39S ribosomal protein L39, mitochondrial [Trichinella nativa]|uniref:39S ribosomal protein L39, mitochondrial n=1 Tax=Trichinella nativa TaxID=6335 RepID=A0A0V1LKK3_9BILA|nr:39S ribosomal protein L39, mitochondrial [Trichinella nativa]KRZ60004.1 39S ribosomal protein L39, mitochondrial [Trichinella nativa]KRZ60005.1 39S ribosomal protein L39, mitochondrial [Trichinella nativa]
MSTTGLLGSGGGHHRWCFGKVKSADQRQKSRPKAVEEYEKEESEILEQIEKIRLSKKKTSLATSFNGAACWRRRAEWRSFNQSTSERGSSLLSTSATMMQPMPGDLLTSMCHLMNFVVHLRRENRHLRRQIVCLDEMRKVERLQCEILQSACACIAVNRRQSNNASSLDAESGYEASNCSQLATEGPTAGSQLIFNSLNHQRTDSNNTTTDTSSVQSPTSTSHSNRAPLFLSKTDDHFLDCNQLVKNDHSIQPSLSTAKQHNLLKPMDPSRRDSDDQVIFSEVLLPNYNSSSSSNSGAKKLSLQNRQSLPINHCSSTSSTACYAPLSFPETNSGRVSRLLERFGIKRHSWKKSIRSSASVEEDRRRQSERGATSEPHLHHGSSSSPTFSQLRPRTELIFHNSTNKQRLLTGRKAFLKKRKRKISESDSWASSEASKVYSVIEIPEKLDLKFRGLATKPFSLVKKKDGFDEASFSADVPCKEVMDSVMVENPFYLDDSVEPAKESTIVPLRTTKQAMRITSPEKALLHHASVDKQRISEKYSANYFRTDPGLSNLLQTAGVNLSLTPSQMTVSNDSVFTSHETDLNRYVSGMNVLKQLLALQEKNSILIRQLREKTSEYESIVERVANLEGSMKTLRNRLKFNNLLESLFERNIEKHCVPLSVLHTVRNSLLEKLNAYSNVNVELMQTQSSLLLAHAQIERQRLEIQQLSNRNARIRRADSYHDLPKDSSSDAVAMQAFSQTKQLNSNNNSTPPIGRGISKSEKEPRNSGIDIRQKATMSGGFEGSTSRLPASLLVKKQSPSLQRLSKMGHVRALAATFDSPNGLKVDEKYPPGTSMNPFEYSLHYANKANTFAGRITSESEEISRKKNNNAALLASTMSTTSSVSCLKSNIPTNVVNIREVSNRTATPKNISRSVTNQFLPIKSANICYDKELRKSNKSDTTNVDEVPSKTTTATQFTVLNKIQVLFSYGRRMKYFFSLKSTLRRQLSLQDARMQRSLVFEEEKVRQENLLGKVEKIVVKMQLPNSYLPKYGNSFELVMNANMSTPYHCAMHVSRMLADRSPLALVNNKPWDMHRPLPSTDCNLQFLFFTDLNPHLVNKAFWRTCSFVLGYIFETSLKKSIGVTLHSWPFVNVSSGSFIYDIALQMNNNLTIKKEDLDVLGRVVVDDLRKKNFPFERLEVGVDVLEEMFKNNNFKLEQIKNMANKGDGCGTFSVYRMGDHVDISKGPMISSTAQLGLYSVTAIHPIQTKDNLSLYRVQGCALPFNQRVNSWTWETVCRTSANLNLIPEEKKYATRSFNLSE